MLRVAVINVSHNCDNWFASFPRCTFLTWHGVQRKILLEEKVIKVVRPLEVPLDMSFLFSTIQDLQHVLRFIEHNSLLTGEMEREKLDRRVIVIERKFACNPGRFGGRHATRLVEVVQLCIRRCIFWQQQSGNAVWSFAQVFSQVHN